MPRCYECKEQFLEDDLKSRGGFCSRECQESYHDKHVRSREPYGRETCMKHGELWSMSHILGSCPYCAAEKAEAGKVNKLHHVIDTQNQTILRQGTKIDQQEVQIDKANEQIRSLTQEADDLAQRVDRLMQEVDECRTCKRGNALDEERARLISANEIIDEQAKQIRSLTQKADDLAQRVDRLMQEVARLEDEAICEHCETQTNASMPAVCLPCHNRYASTVAAVDRSPYDISPCKGCGLPVVCLPDGLPYCRECGEEQ